MEILTKSEYARRVKLSRPTVDKRIREGKLKTVKICGVDYIKYFPEKICRLKK